MWKCRWSKSIIKFLHAEKIAPIDIHQHLLNSYGDQTVHISTVKWWVLHFSCGWRGHLCWYRFWTNMACRLLFIAGKKCIANGDCVGKTVLCHWEIALIVLLLLVSIVVSMEKIGDITLGATYTYLREEDILFDSKLTLPSLNANSWKCL